MNLIEDIKPFSTSLFNPSCERSTWKPSQVYSTYPAEQQLPWGYPPGSRLIKEAQTLNGEASFQPNNAIKAESYRGDCVRHTYREGESKVAEVARREERNGTSYIFQCSTSTQLQSEESFPAAHNKGLYIVRPSTANDRLDYSQSKGVTAGITSNQGDCSSERPKRMDQQPPPFPPGGPSQSQFFPPLIARVPQYQETPLPRAATADLAREAAPQNRFQETWNSHQALYPVYNPWGWHRARQPHPLRTGPNYCGTTPSKYYHGQEVDRFPSVQREVISQDKERREEEGLSYQSSRETFCRSQHSQGERRTNCYIANTESEAQWYDQRQYGRRDVRGCAPPDPRSDYDRQEWIRTQHSQNSRNLEDDTAITKNKIRQDQGCLAFPCRSQVAYIAQGRYNGLPEKTVGVESQRYSPVIIDCYSLAASGSSGNDSTTPPEHDKEARAPSMALNDDRIHHRNVRGYFRDVRTEFSGLDPHASHASTFPCNTRVQSRDVESHAQNGRNRSPTQLPKSKQHSMSSSWSAELACRVSCQTTLVTSPSHAPCTDQYPDREQTPAKHKATARPNETSPEVSSSQSVVNGGEEDSADPSVDISISSAQSTSDLVRVQPSSEQPDEVPTQVRITAHDGVISVDTIPLKEPGSSPVNLHKRLGSSLHSYEQIARAWCDNVTTDKGRTNGKFPEEIPDLSVYAQAFNITDLEDCYANSDMDTSDDVTTDGQSDVQHSKHSTCFCDNPFCCGALSRDRYNDNYLPKQKEKRFNCRFCGRRFAHLSTLQNHVRVHTGDKPYQCKHCTKRFAQSGVLKAHVRTHTGDKPFHCPFCNSMFAQSTTLTNHLRIHTGHKPFVCKHCSKAFSQPSTLRKHEISHTSERPYPCKVCGRAFVQQSTLKNHMRSHTGQKPYKCPFCSRGFAQLSTMDRHLKVHTSYRYKPHQCPYCEKSFTYLSNLTNHLQIHSKPLDCVS